MSRRRILATGLAWLGAVLISGTVAWNAVAVISDDSARTGVLSPDQVAASLAVARATPTPSTTAHTASPSAGPTDTPAPTESPVESPSATPSSEPSSPPAGTQPPSSPAPTTETRTWQVTGGTVTVQCVGATIALVAATPADGWTVGTGSTGPQTVEVELRRSEHETKVTATCQGGVPVSAVHDEGDDDHGSDDGD